VAVWHSGNITGHINDTYSMPGPVSTWMGDRLQAGKPSQYVTATEVNSAFCLPWDGIMSISFQAE